MEVSPGTSRDAWAELLSLGNAGNDLDAGDDLDADRAADLVAYLNRRGDPAVVTWALPTLSAPDRWQRRAAAWVLGDHGFRDGRPFAREVMPALAAAGRSEADDRTRDYLVTAIGHADDPAWADELISYATDPYAPIRETVARCLPTMFAGDEMNQRTIDVLISLTRDPDPRVRDWATMGIGSQSEQDSDAIRAALRARLDDTEDDDEIATTGEAALGLALRHDPSVYPYLQRWLDGEPAEIGNLVVEAAGALGDRRLLPALLHLRAADWQRSDPRPQVLDEAIDALEELPEQKPT